MQGRVVLPPVGEGGLGFDAQAFLETPTIIYVIPPFLFGE